MGSPGSESRDLEESVGSSRTSSEEYSCLASRIKATSAPIVWPEEVPEGIFAQSAVVPAMKPRTGSPFAAVVVPPSAAVLGIELSCFAAEKPAIASVADFVAHESLIDPRLAC